MVILVPCYAIGVVNGYSYPRKVFPRNFVQTRFAKILRLENLPLYGMQVYGKTPLLRSASAAHAYGMLYLNVRLVKIAPLVFVVVQVACG